MNGEPDVASRMGQARDDLGGGRVFPDDRAHGALISDEGGGEIVGLRHLAGEHLGADDRKRGAHAGERRHGLRQARLPRWSKVRVVLTGDAAWFDTPQWRWRARRTPSQLVATMAEVTPTGGRGDKAPLFDPLPLGRLRLRNRLAVAPMTRVSATAMRYAIAEMAAYYGAFAKGGFGLVITEGVYPS